MEDGEEGGAHRQELSFGAGLADGGGRALQLSLPAQMGMEPEGLQRIKCAGRACAVATWGGLAC